MNRDNYTLVRFQSRVMNFEDACTISGDSDTDHFHLRPICHDAKCSMSIGGENLDDGVVAYSGPSRRRLQGIMLLLFIILY